MTFRVGMKVVLIRDSWSPVDVMVAPARPIKGAVYTVRGMFRGGLYLVEINNPPLMWGDIGLREPNFHQGRFRPAVSPGISFDTSIPADPDSEQYDNRRRVAEPAWGVHECK